MTCAHCGGRRRSSRARYCAPCGIKARATWVLIGNSATRAAKKGLEHTITDEWVRARLDEPCAVTGLPFVFYRSGQRGQTHPFSPSLDRINNLKGYTPENTRVVVLMFNNAKNTATDAEVYEFCQRIVSSSARSPAPTAARATTSRATRTAMGIASAAATTPKQRKAKQLDLFRDTPA